MPSTGVESSDPDTVPPSSNHSNSLEQGEEAERLKEVGPHLLLQEDGSAYLQPPLELPHHNVSGGVGHIEGGVLLGVCWRDDGHQVVPVRRVNLQQQNRDRVSNIYYAATSCSNKLCYQTVGIHTDFSLGSTPFPTTLWAIMLN